jgi:sulfate adenylyltransferase
LDNASTYRHIVVDSGTISEIEMIANGAFSPLTGFMNEEEYQSVLHSNHLPDGTIWPVPITLTISQNTVDGLKTGESVILVGPNGNRLALMKISSIFEINFSHEITVFYESQYAEWLKNQYQKPRHRIALGGDLVSLAQAEQQQNHQYHLSPVQSRAHFKKRGWQRIAAFEKPAPIGFSQNSVETCMLEIADGLFFQPSIGGPVKSGLVTQKLKQYLVAGKNYYPKDAVVMGYISRQPRFSGPHEVVLSAIIRKNYGCSHYLISEKEYMQHSILSFQELRRFVKNFPAEALDITLIFSEETYYCHHCKHIVTHAHQCQYHSDRFFVKTTRFQS